MIQPVLISAAKQFVIGSFSALIIHDHFFSFARVDGISMQPSLNPGLFLLKTF